MDFANRDSFDGDFAEDGACEVGVSAKASGACCGWLGVGAGGLSKPVGSVIGTESGDVGASQAPDSVREDRELLKDNGEGRSTGYVIFEPVLTNELDWLNVFVLFSRARELANDASLDFRGVSVGSVSEFVD